MTYVLIIMLSGSGSAIGSVEFSSKAACEAAGKAAAEARPAFNNAVTVFTACSPKA